MHLNQNSEPKYLQRCHYLSFYILQKLISHTKFLTWNHFCSFFRDDHQFSPLHWAAKGGHTKIVEMLISRGARVHSTNMGDDTPLHLAAAHGNRDIVLMVRLYSVLNLKQFYIYFNFFFSVAKT